MIPKFALDELHARTRELSDKEFQARMWRGKDPRVESSYDDVSFFLLEEMGAYNLEDYSHALGSTIALETIRMIELLRAYDDKRQPHDHNFQGPAWDAVVAQAGVVVQLYTDHGISLASHWNM